jgi:EthD domain
VEELWFDGIDELNRAFNEPRHLEIIRPDELKFADIANCVSMVTEVVTIFG